MTVFNIGIFYKVSNPNVFSLKKFRDLGLEIFSDYNIVSYGFFCSSDLTMSVLYIRSTKKIDEVAVKKLHFYTNVIDYEYLVTFENSVSGEVFFDIFIFNSNFFSIYNLYYDEYPNLTFIDAIPFTPFSDGSIPNWMPMEFVAYTTLLTDAESIVYDNGIWSIAETGERVFQNITEILP